MCVQADGGKQGSKQAAAGCLVLHEMNREKVSHSYLRDAGQFQKKHIT